PFVAASTMGQQNQGTFFGWRGPLPKNTRKRTGSRFNDKRFLGKLSGFFVVEPMDHESLRGNLRKSTY
ncbi:MAG: hypothetical protein VYC97_08205, partial [SAR324 cluster bacterium]|nr:hypothetical protein [SAR324 cluster bacterium]